MDIYRLRVWYLYTALFLALQYVLCVQTQVILGKGTATQYFGTWTTWSGCSRSCDPELTWRSRSCNKPSNLTSNIQQDFRVCKENKKQYKVCDKKKCHGRKRDYRNDECHRQTHTPFRGRRYHWDPFINPKSPCEVSCKSRNYGFYTGFGRPVKDGISCAVSTTNKVCLQGKCQAVGCDGIVGSGTRKDHCGVCGGDNDSCRIIAGIFTRRHLKYGYNQVTSIPKGACHINITELDRSRNYLVLTYANGTGVINSNRGLMKRPGVYEAGGASFRYNKVTGQHCPGECLYAEGPLTDDMDIQLLFYRKNTGIKYMFTVPKNMIESVLQGYEPTSKLGQGHSQGYHRNNQNSSSANFNSAKRRINYDQQPKYVSPERSNEESKGYQALQSTENGHSTQDAINRFRQGYAQGTVSDSQLIKNHVDTARTLDKSVSANRNNNYLYSNNIPEGIVPDSNYNGNGYQPSRIPTGAGSNYSPYPSRTGSQVYNRQYQQTRDQYPGSYNSHSSNNVIENTKPKLTIPNTVDEVNFHWTISGFTECSRSCGGGSQDTNVVCMKRKSNVKVTDANCDPSKKKVQTIICNKKPCPPAWEDLPWSLCSTTCGSGIQTRRVECQQRYSENVSIPVSASKCDFSGRPVTSQACQVRPCAEWVLANWTKCSVECGLGQESRTVDCLNTEGVAVPEVQCAGPKPDTTKSCDMGTCAKGWFQTSWTKECSSDCGKGYHTRAVYCLAEDGSSLPESKCGPKPKTRKPCRKSRPCGGFWFEGPWSSCSASCGLSTQSRDVVCMKKLHKDLFAVVKEVNCKEHRRPPTTQPCPTLPDCPSQWYMTKWTPCSKSCGTGIKTRDLKCIDDRQSPSSQCDREDKPGLRRTCNTQDCDLPQLDEDPGCKDSWNQCYLVVQASLCSSPFYNEKCCEACKLHHLKHKLQRDRELQHAAS